VLVKMFENQIKKRTCPRRDPAKGYKGKCGEFMSHKEEYDKSKSVLIRTDSCGKCGYTDRYIVWQR